MADQKINPGISLAGAVDLESMQHQVKAEPGQAGGAPAAGAYVVDVSEHTFEAMVQTSATFPILLLLWTPTDDRLFPMARTLADAVNKLNGQIQLVRIDAGASPTIAQAFQVRGIPALFGLIGGRPMPLLEGLPSAEEQQQIVDQVIPKLIEVAHKAGVNGTAPYSGDPDAHAAYERVLESDPHDALAARERAKALLLARSGNADVRAVRAAAAAHPDDVEAQLAVADIDMIGGQIEDAFGRLLDYLAAGHRDQIEPVRKRLLEYFAIPESGDERLKRARRRLATLMY